MKKIKKGCLNLFGFLILLAILFSYIDVGKLTNTVLWVRDFFDPSSVNSIRRGVSVACQGVGVPAAGVYQPGNDLHILLMKGGNPSGKLNSEWKPGSLGDVELVICLDSPTNILIETCRYSMGGTVERYRTNQPVRLVVAQTGDVLASNIFVGNPGGCPSAKVGNGHQMIQGNVTSGLIEKWVLSVLPSRNTPAPPLTAAPTRTPLPTSTPLPVEVTFDTIANYPAGHLVTLVGRLVMTSSIKCNLSECSLLLENPAHLSQTITIFVTSGFEPNQVKPLYDQYTKSDIQVQLDDGTFAVIGYRIRVTGKVCSTANKEPCISEITRIELFQLK